MSLRFTPSRSPYRGSQAGNPLPLPRSGGGAFPFLLTVDGSPIAPAKPLWDKGLPSRPPETEGLPCFFKMFLMNQHDK